MTVSVEEPRLTAAEVAFALRSAVPASVRAQARARRAAYRLNGSMAVTAATLWAFDIADLMRGLHG